MSSNVREFQFQTLVDTAKGTDSAKSYQAINNTRGQLISVKSDAGRELSFEYDDAGRQTALTDAQKGAFKTEYDNAGRITARRLPVGASYYEYDARGAVKKQSDSTGNSLTVERDASGAILNVLNADGSWTRATHDEAGRVIAVTKSNGKSRRYTYNARGAVASYTDELGKQRIYEYDRRGRLRTVIHGDGSKTIIERDRRGLPQRISLSNGDRLRYEYDRFGRLVNLHRESRTVKFMSAGFNFSEPLARAHVLKSSTGTWDDWDDWGYDWEELLLDIGGGGGGLWFSGGGWGGDYFFYDNFFDDVFWGGWNPFFGLGGETCFSCMDRQQRICETARQSCIKKATAGTAFAGIACTAVTGGIGLLVCGGLALAGDALLLSSCNDDAAGCNLAAIDKCPQC